MKFWNWLKSWFVDGEKFDVYRPSERLIYKYFDGCKVIKGDPLELYKKTMNVGPELAIDIKVATAAVPMKGTKEAHENMMKKLRTIFSIKPLNEGGLTEVETINLFDHFMNYTETLKKNSVTSVTSSSPTEDSKTSSEPVHPTSNSSDCGSTAEESCTVEQEPLLTEQQSPSEPSVQT